MTYQIKRKILKSKVKEYVQIQPKTHTDRKLTRATLPHIYRLRVVQDFQI